MLTLVTLMNGSLKLQEIPDCEFMRVSRNLSCVIHTLPELTKYLFEERHWAEAKVAEYIHGLERGVEMPSPLVED